MRKFILLMWFFLAAATLRAQEWTSLGPAGGDVRALAVDPAHRERVFLGTADGHIFGSRDSGLHWTLLGRASTRPDAVITAIVVDPRDGNTLFASSWGRDAAGEGGVFRTNDGGRTWSEAGLAGHAVRALSMAPSDPRILVAGTLEGLYRSTDSANTWERISPEHHPELRNFDSVAIDPQNPQIMYAGTFHLPWKTEDGGQNWAPVHDGMIDDSDVMSLLIDGGNSGRIYASACSGIYRSENAARQWKKIQGIPYAARRTYVITQDRRQTSRVYAATSEGLWKTEDAGMTWRRTTPESWAVNTVVVLDGVPGKVLIGTEQFGVLASDDGGEHFSEANVGFAHRQVLALASGGEKSGRLAAVLAHAPDALVASDDRGATWFSLGTGVRAEQVRHVYSAPDGTWWLALERGGLLRYDSAKKGWEAAGMRNGGAAKSPKPSSGYGEGKESNPGKNSAASSSLPEVGHAGNTVKGRYRLTEVVNDLAFAAKEWFAATRSGLMVSIDQGATWRPEPVAHLPALEVASVWVSSDGRRIRLASVRGLVFSDDAGESWSWHDLPPESGGALTLDDPETNDSLLLSAARNGLYLSRDAAKTWQQAAAGLPATPVHDLAVSGDTLVAAMSTGGLYVSFDRGRNWDRVTGAPGDGFFSSVLVSPEPGIFWAASRTEGLYRLDLRSPARVGSHEIPTGAASRQ